MEKKLWEELPSKILTIIIAILVFAYLFFDVIIKSTELTHLHLWLLLIVLVLLLVNLAGRLKILNFLDYRAKFNTLREDTNSKLEVLRQQISLYQNVNPVQHQTTTIFDEKIMKLLLGQLEDKVPLSSSIFPPKTVEYTEYNREAFLSRADAIRLQAFNILQIARIFQIALLRHKLPSLPDSNVSGKVLSRDEGLSNVVDEIIKDDIKVLFPFELTQDEQSDNIAWWNDVEDTKQDLKKLDKLLDLRNKAANNEPLLLTQEEIDKLLNEVKRSLDNLRVAIAVTGTTSIINHHAILTAVENLRNELRSESDETKSSTE